MKIKLFILLTTILTINCYSQIVFKKGYFIDNSGEKTEGLIKDVGWKNNPTDFEFKLSETGTVELMGINSVQEFNIYENSKYVRADVKIDRSTDDVYNLSETRNPIFKDEKLFLEVLIESKASLFFYAERNLRRYFYSINDSNIEQLIYKRYKSDDKTGVNNQYKKQLSVELSCSKFEESVVERLDYVKRDLVDIFTAYNECVNAEFVVYKQTDKSNILSVSIRARGNQSSLTMTNPALALETTDFGTEIGYGLGAELEMTLPFNKNKWALIIEPTYQSFESETRTLDEDVTGGVIISKVDYSSIELPMGLRYYVFLNSSSKVFINGSYIFDFSSNSTFEFTREDGSIIEKLTVSSSQNIAAGIGYKYQNKYSLELRYMTSRNVLADFAFLSSEYKTMSVILGYTLF